MTRPEAASPPAGSARGAFRLLGVLAGIGCVQVLFTLGVELDRTVQHHEAIAQLRDDVRALEREAAGLQATLENTEDDAFREQLARGQGFMWPDETRLIVIPASTP